MRQRSIPSQLPTATPKRPYTGIDRTHVEELVTHRNLRARRRVLLLDTCHSGSGVEGARGLDLAPFREQEINQLRRGKGIYVLAASSDEDLAREQDGNGIFTRAIVEGLSGEADRDGNLYIEIEELVQFARDRVHELSQGQQASTLPLVKGGESFRLARVIEDRPSD